MTVPDLPANLGAIGDRWADSERIAYVDLTAGDEPVEVGFGPVVDLTARVAGYLLAGGLRPGDRVGILADNSVAFGACYLGICRAGGVTVPLNTRQPADNLAFVADDAGLTLVFHDDANAHRLPPGIPAISFDQPAWRAVAEAPPAPAAAVEPDDVAVQMYTSGSTGRPKGVLLSHGGQLFSIGQYLGGGVLPMDSGERLIVSAPMYHKNAMMQLKMSLTLGGTVVLLRRFEAKSYLRAVAEHRATAVGGVPTMFALMAAQTGLVADLDLTSVRRASIGSAPMTEALHAQAGALFPNAVVTNGYGTTEVVAVFGGHPEDRPRPAISVGHPLATVETRLVDPATGVDATPDPATGRRQGELWVRGPGTMVGYHNRPETTAERLTDGWYHTGDVMEADTDGWHFFVGRVDDMFTCGGENVYPGDVEQLLERSPQVHQAAVVAVPDALKGALPVAFVVPAAGAEPGPDLATTITAWALEHGPAYQHPRAVWFVDEIPLAGTAKIDKAALTDEAARRWTPRPHT